MYPNYIGLNSSGIACLSNRRGQWANDALKYDIKKIINQLLVLLLVLN